MMPTLEKIVENNSDYKFCPDCGQLNWADNKECFLCNYPLENVDNPTIEEMKAFEEQEVQGWIEEGITDTQAYAVRYDVK